MFLLKAGIALVFLLDVALIYILFVRKAGPVGAGAGAGSVVAGGGTSAVSSGGVMAQAGGFDVNLLMLVMVPLLLIAIVAVLAYRERHQGNAEPVIGSQGPGNDGSTLVAGDAEETAEELEAAVKAFIEKEADKLAPEPDKTIHDKISGSVERFFKKFGERINKAIKGEHYKRYLKTGITGRIYSSIEKRQADLKTAKNLQEFGR
jgi:hypothetical protein